MADDLFEDVLDIEDRFYQEGYDAGVADGEHAGLLEGKIFGIEKGYDKALELGRLRGRALVWKHRQHNDVADAGTKDVVPAGPELGNDHVAVFTEARAILPTLSSNTRLTKNIELLLALTEPSKIPTDNTDESVEKIEDLTAKASNKAKIIASTVGEHFEPTGGAASSIEDSMGLSARH